MLSFVGLREPWQKRSSAKYYYHLYWVDNTAAEQGREYWTQSAGAETLRRRASELTASWKGSGKATMELAHEEDMMVPPFVLASFAPPAALPRGRVTLLGDAAHTMTPFRGIGANTALKDAVDLACRFEENKSALAGKTEVTANVDVVEMLKAYEKEMIPRGREAVESSVMMLQKDPEGAQTVAQFQQKEK